MKVMVVDGEYRHNLTPILRSLGFQIVTRNPDVIITYGGDGTLLGAERDYPGIPKLPVRDGDPDNPQTHKRFERQLKRLKDGDYIESRYFKLQVTVRDETMLALNDITIRQQHQPSSLRYKIWVNDLPCPHEIVGDGIVAATVFGSTAYYRSITDSTFHVGIGLAFNNSTEQINHQVLREDAVIRMKITRGPASVFADNDPRSLTLNVGEFAEIRSSEQEAVILGISNLRRADSIVYAFHSWGEKREHE